MGRIDTVITNDRHSDLSRKVDNIAVQVDGKRMGSINNQADAMFLAESDHLGHFHCTSDVDAVDKLDFLDIATGGIIVNGARFFEHLSRHAALSRSTEYQNHSF